MAGTDADTDLAAYNTPTPVSWSKAWQTDPLGGGLSAEWPALIESFRAKTPLGTEAPDFTGDLLDGGQFRLSDHRGRKSVLIVFGSYACPPCVTNIRLAQPSLVSLYAQHREAIEFCYVYSREGHPGEKIVPHASIEQKRANARRLKESEGITFPLVVDALDGPIQRSYVDIRFNNPVFLVNRAGLVTYKSAWLDSSELPQVLEDQSLWDLKTVDHRTLKKTYSERIRTLREPFDPTCKHRIDVLMGEIGLPLLAMGPSPGLNSDIVRADAKEGAR